MPDDKKPPSPKPDHEPSSELDDAMLSGDEASQVKGGIRVATGDVNGDGFYIDDIVIGVKKPGR